MLVKRVGCGRTHDSRGSGQLLTVPFADDRWLDAPQLHETILVILTAAEAGLATLGQTAEIAIPVPDIRYDKTSSKQNGPRK